jgi:hypothetical protein
MKTIWQNNGLSIALGLLFLAAMIGQIASGWYQSNDEARTHGQPTAGLSRYLTSGHFWEATAENWESEFLQMTAFLLLTTSLRQKGSAESKRIGVVENVDLDPARFRDEPDVPGPVRRGGWQLRLYQHSLGMAFAGLFVISFILHGVGGLQEFNNERSEHHQPPATLREYMTSSSFWFESFQNWQSEFLSIGAMVVGSIFLRQRGSAESKPVHAPHSETGR